MIVRSSRKDAGFYINKNGNGKTRTAGDAPAKALFRRILKTGRRQAILFGHFTEVIVAKIAELALWLKRTSSSYMQ